MQLNEHSVYRWSNNSFWQYKFKKGNDIKKTTAVLQSLIVVFFPFKFESAVILAWVTCLYFIVRIIAEQHCYLSLSSNAIYRVPSLKRSHVFERESRKACRMEGSLPRDCKNETKTWKHGVGLERFGGELLRSWRNLKNLWAWVEIHSAKKIYVDHNDVSANGSA